ncbi:Protein slit [Holothuria leucospilota]|uniref:Protein slit n=1 Tax=Holothuria leucospilota TaxID=206669 RepID=A0A9Q0YH30_HOLLE|nr:Protein slit [Holothuria leucospilota]
MPGGAWRCLATISQSSSSFPCDQLISKMSYWYYFLLVLLALNASGSVMGQSDQCVGTPCDCSQTDIVDCAGQGLTEIPQFPSFFSQRLELLDFSDNNFETFDPNQLFGQFGSVGIKLLNLSNNQLTSIASSFGVTNMIPSYDKIDLSNNKFTEFPGKAFPLQFTRVDLEIDISNNQLTTLPTHFIANNVEGIIPRLTLNASNNLIDSIHPMAFEGNVITELRLDLTNNQLTNISEDFYFPVSQEREFKMSGNPWNCDCNLRWLLNSDFREISMASPPVCNDPPPLRERDLFDLKEDEFVCPPEAPDVEGELQINKGNNFLLCPATADPESSLNITWSFALTCHPGSRPLRLIAQSNTATIKDVTCFPQSNITCTAENYAGFIEIDLNALRSDDIGSCPMDDGNSRRNGGFVFLVILVVISILICFSLGGYYLYLWNEMRKNSLV